MKKLVIILRTTSNCNLACTYCYDKKNHYQCSYDSNQYFLKSIDNLLSFISKISNHGYFISEIILHGGEPLLIHYKTYDLFLSKLKALLPNTRISVQTNGTLINMNYIKLFSKYNISVGLSLDGFNNIQNSCRVYKNGKPSFNRVMNSLNILKESNIDFGLILTLTKSHIGKEKEIYDFIAKNNIKCNIRPAFPLSSESNTNNLNILTNQEYAKLFKNLFHIWFFDKYSLVKLTQIKELYEEMQKVLAPSSFKGSCACSNSCMSSFISLDLEGNIYSCNRTYNNSVFYFGNLRKDTVNDIFSRAHSLETTRNTVILRSKCHNCVLFQFCHGGCPANAYSQNQNINMADDYFCSAKINIFKFVTRLVTKYQNNNRS